MIKPGDTLHQLFHLEPTHQYQIYIPGEQDARHVQDHVNHCHVTDDLYTVEVEIKSITKAEKRDTQPCPAPMDDEESDRVFRQQMDTLTEEKGAAE